MLIEFLLVRRLGLCEMEGINDVLQVCLFSRESTISVATWQWPTNYPQAFLASSRRVRIVRTRPCR